MEYDALGRLARTKRRDDCLAASAGDRQEYVYDSEGLVTEIDTYDAASTLTRKQPMTYFASRRLQSLVNPVDPTKATALVYDAGGMIAEVDGAAGLSKTTYAINNDRRITAENRYKTSTTYDTWSLLYDWLGEQSTVTDGDNKATQSVRDDLGRVVKLVSPDLAFPTLRIYDAASRLTSVVEAFGGGASQQTHAFTYDALGRLQASDFAGACATTGTPHAEIQRVYDAPPPSTCPIGAGCNRTTGRLAYVKVSLMCSSAYAATDGSLDQETWYSYDDAGRLIDEYAKDDTGRSADHQYAWTKAGALTQATMPSTTVFGWSYGSAASNSDTDRVTGQWRTSTATPVTDTVRWNPYGPLQQYNQENYVSTIQQRTRITRNLAYRITGLYVETVAGAIQQSVVVAEDAKGRVTQRDYYPNNTGVQDSSFFYDYEDRVICEANSLTTTCPTVNSGLKNRHDLTPPFTNAGDWKHLLRPIAGSTGGYTHDFNASGTKYTSHQINDVVQPDGTPAFGTTHYTYDARGNRSSDDNVSTLSFDARTYTYDGRRNVINVRGQYPVGAGVFHYYDVASAFDAKNRRVYKSFLDETTLKTAQWFFEYDALDRLTEVRYTPDSTVPATYSLFQLFWLGDRMVAYWQTDYPAATTTARYVGTDESGRPIDMICWNAPSNHGNCPRVWAVNPSAWGFDTNVAGPGVYQPLLFAGQYVDAETAAYENDGATVHRPGVAVNGARSYDASVGEYLQFDPLAPLTRSSYVYVDSSPIGRRDPTGMMQSLHCTYGTANDSDGIGLDNPIVVNSDYCEWTAGGHDGGGGGGGGGGHDDPGGGPWITGPAPPFKGEIPYYRLSWRFSGCREAWIDHRSEGGVGHARA
jgi:RHS repeat-associated protein